MYTVQSVWYCKVQYDSHDTIRCNTIQIYALAHAERGRKTETEKAECDYPAAGIDVSTRTLTLHEDSGLSLTHGTIVN